MATEIQTSAGWPYQPAVITVPSVWQVGNSDFGLCD